MALVCLFVALTWVNSSASTYYIDIVNGHDTNTSTQATSQSTPWAHAPGMACATNNAAAYSVQPADQFIFKGGTSETWTNSCFPWTIAAGTSGNSTYWGVDKTWFQGGSWTRPVMTGSSTVISGGAPNSMFNIGANTTLDNWEVTGYYVSTSVGTTCAGSAYSMCAIFNFGQNSGQIAENMYVHGWTHDGIDHNNTCCIFAVMLFGGLRGANGQIAHDNVIVGTDVAADHSVNAFFNGPSDAYNNYIKQVSSAVIVSYPDIYHDNHIEDVGPAYCNTTAGTVNTSGTTVSWVSGSTFTTGSSWNGLQLYINDAFVGTVSSVSSSTSLVASASLGTQNGVPYAVFSNAGLCTHENGFEDNGDTGLWFYNNVITNVSAGLALWMAPNPGSTATAWNNLIWAVHDSQILDVPAPPIYNATFCTGTQGGRAAAQTGAYCNIGGSITLWNNTVQCGDNSTLYDNCNVNIGSDQSGGTLNNAILYQNNHFVTLSASATSCYTGTGPPVSCTFSNNIIQTLSTANGQGYTSGQAFAFSPTSGGSTIGAGTNLTSSATGNVTSLTSDTTYGCSDVSNAASCPARTTNARPGSGAWDAGAYQFVPPPGPTINGSFTITGTWN